MGFPQLFTGMGLLLPPEAIGLLGEPAEHWVGIHLPEHPGFAVAAGLGMGQGFGLQQHHIGDAFAGQAGCAAEAGHAATNDDNRRAAGQGREGGHVFSPKLRPMGSVEGVAATSSRAAVTESPWSSWLR